MKTRTAAREEEATRTPVLLLLMTYMLPTTTIGLVTLRYQNNPDKVFVDNVVPLLCFIASTAVYWLLAETMTKVTVTNFDGNWFRALKFAALASGLLSVLSQVSLVFLPYPDSHMPLLFWIPIPVIFVTWHISRYMYYKFISPGMQTLAHIIRCLETTHQRPSLPV